MRKAFGIAMAVCIFCSCGKGGVFGSRTPHEKYSKMLSESGMKNTVPGRAWLEAAEKALNDPLEVETPYAETGYFITTIPRAVGLLFAPRRGEKLSFEFSRQMQGNNLFVDLWKINASGKRDLVKSLDSSEQRWSYDVKKDEKLLLRIQPQLLVGGEYTVSVTVGPSLAFPVPGNEKNIGSLWGAPRGGGRLHEGIDIFAARGTPAVAVDNGTVSSVTNNRLGGKVVFLRTSGKSLSIYYAHLDSQLVRVGQTVKRGDTVGLVGNTGNAISTPPHLHFGIYTGEGAIDPLAFVDPVIRRPGKIGPGIENLGDTVRINRAFEVNSRKQPTSTGGILVAVTAGPYHILLPDGSVARLPASAVQRSLPVIRNVRIGQPSYLLDQPKADAARIFPLSGSSSLKVLALFNDHSLVESEEGVRGWISNKDITGP
jgi:peptidoglycan LD-endopeptidase LytH